MVSRLQNVLGRLWVPLSILMLGMGLTVSMMWTGEVRSSRSAGEIMDRRPLFVTEAVSSSVKATMADATAAAGLFLASEDVTSAEFARFVDSLGQDAGALGLAYIPPGDHSAVSAELGGQVDDGLFRFDEAGEQVPSRSSVTRYPVHYFVPAHGSGLDLRGFDAGSDPVWVEVLGRASSEGAVQVSRITQLFGVPGQRGFLAVAPIVEDAGTVGFVVSVVRLEGLVEGELAESLAEVVVWDINDIVAGAAAAVSADPLRRTDTLEVGGRVWRVEVTPTGAARSELSEDGLVTAAVAGTLLSVLAALVVHLAVGIWRSRREAEELQRLTDEKDEFLAAISHELRTPLTVVVGMAEILEESTVGADPELREYVSLLRQEGRQLARLVEDLLLVGRLDAKVLPMRPEVVDLDWEVERIITEVEARKHVTVSVVGEGRAWADPLRLRHIVRHLYTNALRHGGASVTIRIEARRDEAVVEVCDDGEGVPQGQLDAMFTGFSGMKETPGGPATLGLGLRVSKRLAMVLGGDLTYRRIDNLTVFSLRLPPAEAGVSARVDSADRRHSLPRR